MEARSLLGPLWDKFGHHFGTTTTVSPIGVSGMYIYVRDEAGTCEGPNIQTRTKRPPTDSVGGRQSLGSTEGLTARDLKWSLSCMAIVHGKDTYLS